jgi:hypothetical protein
MVPDPDRFLPSPEANATREPHAHGSGVTGSSRRGQAPFVRSTGHRPKVGRAVPAEGSRPLFRAVLEFLVPRPLPLVTRIGTLGTPGGEGVFAVTQYCEIGHPSVSSLGPVKNRSQE